MAFQSDFRSDGGPRGDGEFLKLLTRRPDVNLVAAALEIARDADPGLDAAAVDAWIEARAAEVRGPVARAESEADALAELGRCLHGVHGLTGSCAAYDTPDGSYLHRVIETGVGLPISLSVLYMAVAERVGLDLAGVAAPQHFLTRYEASDGPLYVDAFHCGRVLTQDECLAFLSNATDLPAPLIAADLAPADGRTIVVRMLNNLKAIYARRGDWASAWHVQHRLVALKPADFRERCDLAVIALHSGRPGQAVDLLKSCLASGPARDRAALEGHLRAAESQLCRMN